jgi:hypothetical protein
MIYLNGMTSVRSYRGGNNYTQSVTTALSGKTLSWYNSMDAQFQLNYNGITYLWIALG